MSATSPALLLTSFGVLVLLAGCNDRYEEGYRMGYSEGRSAGYAEAKKAAEEEQERRQRMTSAFSASSVATQVCGGGGVTVNGRHHSPGKTGCVRVLSDGTVQRY